MASPSQVTLQNLSGKWTLNKSSSDNFATVLALQGVNVLIRKAASTASVHLTVTQPDTQHINMAQSVTAGKIPGTTEEYVLDWAWRENEDGFFGKVQGRSRWVGIEEGVKEGVLKEREGAVWLEGDSEGSLIEAEGKKDGEWEARHLWGFEVVDGERRHTRRVWVRNKEGEEIRVRMVYDWVGA